MGRSADVEAEAVSNGRLALQAWQHPTRGIDQSGWPFDDLLRGGKMILCFSTRLNLACAAMRRHKERANIKLAPSA